MATAPRKLNFCLVGLGRAGKIHLDNLRRHPQCKVLHVVEPNEALAREIAALDECSASSLEDAIADPRVDAVIVASPTQCHYKAISLALAARKPIFTEKPVGDSLAQIDELYTLAAKLNVPLFCAFNRRFEAAWVKCQQRIAQGEVGVPQIMRTSARDNPPPSYEFLETSHGFFHDAGVHDIDVIRWFLKEDPETVFAFTHCYDSKIAAIHEDVDTILMSFKFKSGCVACTDMSRKSPYGYDQRVEVYGSKGMVQVENRPTTTAVFSGPQGVLSDNIQFSFPQRFYEAYYAELEHFVDVVVNGTAPRVTHTDARTAYIIADAARRSAKLGQPVRIDYSITGI